MSLKSLPIPPVPEETARVAHAVFARGNVIMQVRDTLGAIYSDEAFADLFPTHGQPALAPWPLALVTVFQFMVYVLNVLSEVAPDWVRAHVPTEWVERYGERLEHERLPKEEQERQQYANQVGTDGWMLLDALQAPDTPDWMKT